MAMYDGGASAANPPQAELSSNLHETRNRLESFAKQIHQLTSRLNRKNEQLISLPPMERMGVKAGINVRDDSIAVRRPLMHEVNDAVVLIDIAISELHEVVAVTETI